MTTPLYLRSSILDNIKYLRYHGVTMNRLRIIPLDDVVVFPGMPVTLPIDVGTDAEVLLVPRHEHSYAGVGVVAEVSERTRMAGRSVAASLMGLHRAIPAGAAADENGVLRVDFEAR